MIRLALLIVNACPSVEGGFIQSQWRSYADYRCDSMSRLRNLLSEINQLIVNDVNRENRYQNNKNNNNKNDKNINKNDKNVIFMKEENGAELSKERLQWLLQNYIRYFAFDSSNIIDHQFKEFVESLVKIVSFNSKNIVENEALYNKTIGININAFTKYEIINEFLRLIEYKKNVLLQNKNRNNNINNMIKKIEIIENMFSVRIEEKDYIIYGIKHMIHQ